MAVRNIVTTETDDDVLRKKCRPVTVFDEKLAVIIDDMFETLKKADGAGLAAPQIGLLKQIVVIDVGDGPVELINPEIIKESGSQYEVEGCLSCPNEWGYVTRPEKIRCKAQNRHGEVKEYNADGMFARCIAHEMDHLNGRLFTDIADRMLTPDEIEELRRQEEAENKKPRFRKRNSGNTGSSKIAKAAKVSKISKKKSRK